MLRHLLYQVSYIVIIIAFGRAFSGLIVSSAEVEIASNPKYAKNTVVAANITPEKPDGAKLFFQLVGYT